MSASIWNFRKTPSDQLVRIYDELREQITSLMFTILQTSGLISDVRGLSVTKFKQSTHGILEFVFSVETCVVDFEDHRPVIENLDIKIILNLVERKILTIDVDNSGIEWDTDEEIGEEQFNEIYRKINSQIEKVIYSQALNPEVMYEFRKSVIENFTQLMMILLRSSKAAKERLDDEEDDEESDEE